MSFIIFRMLGTLENMKAIPTKIVVFGLPGTVGGCNPFEKYARQIGSFISFPQGSG